MMQRGNIFIGIIILAVLAVGVTLYYFGSKPDSSPKNKVSYPTKSPSPESTKSAEQTKTFQSKNLKFSINMPISYKTEEKLGKVIIATSKGEIYVDRNGTNFTNLKEYLSDLDAHNKNQILQDSPEMIDNYEASNRLLKYSSGEIQKLYTIYIDNWIYNIYTNSEALYNDLDQIARSFKYTP